MITLIRTELLKLRSIRLPWVLLGAACALTAVITVLIASKAGGNGHMAPPPLDTVDGVRQVVTTTMFGLILAMVFGALVSTGEFRHGTATSTWLATPRRAPVVLAKTVAAALVGALYGAATAVISTSVGLAFVAAKSIENPLPASTLLEYAAGATLAAALLAAIGVAIGALVRQQVAAIVAVFAWTMIIEGILGGLFESWAPYLPFNAASTLAGRLLQGEVAGLPTIAVTTLLAGITVAITALAVRTTVRRDIA